MTFDSIPSFCETESHGKQLVSVSRDHSRGQTTWPSRYQTVEIEPSRCSVNGTASHPVYTRANPWSCHFTIMSKVGQYRLCNDRVRQ